MNDATTSKTPAMGPGSPPLSRTERQILLLTCTAHFFTHLFMLIYPTIAVVQARAWGVDVSDLLILTVPGFILYGLGALPFGRWADRVGGSIPVAVGLIGMACGAFVCTAAQEPWHIAAGLGLTGLFASAYHPAGLGLITQGIRRSEWALGVNGSFGSGAVALSPGLAELLSEWVGWRYTFLCLAVPAILIGLRFLLRPVSSNQAPTPDTSGPSTTDPQPTAPLLNPRFLLLCVAMTFAGLSYRGVSVVLPTLFDARVDFMGHGMATSCTYALAIVMNYVGGRLSETFDAPRIYLAFHVLSLPALFATASLSGIPLVLLAAIYAGCALGTQPAENSLVAQLSPARSRSTAFGVKFTLAFGVGALAVPLVSHQLQTADLHTVMLTLAGFTTALVITVSLLSTWLLRAPIRVKP